MQERLDYLDNEYLKNFDANDVQIDADIAMQRPFDILKEETHYYAVTEDEPLENNTYLSYNKVVGTALDKKLYLAMQILDYVLVMAPGAKLKQALIDKGIGTDIYSSLESSVLQPVYSIVAKNAEESQKKAFVDTIEEVLRDIAKNGIDKRMALAGMNYYEFKFREADYGAYPKGLMYYLTMMDSWLYDENEPFIHVQALDTFAQLRKELDEGLFEELIQKYLLDNSHGSLIALVPKRGLEEEKAAEEIGVGVPTLRDIVSELLKPGRDVRDELPKPILRTDVLEMKDLKPGMELTGTVRNVIDFGVFVDIGVHQDGLVHISEVCDRRLRHPSEVVKVGDVVKVVVLNVDEKRHRISLSMKQAK